MQDPTCAHCDNEIRVYGHSEEIKCPECGALYTLSKSEIGDGQAQYEYEFVGFNCIYNSFMDKCENMCPAPFMFCEEHVSDKFINEAERNIKSCEARLQESVERLDKMNESKKTWMIGKLSGIDEPR